MKSIRANRKSSHFLMFYFRIIQAKIIDFFDSQLNSIGVNPYFFRNFLKEWRKMNHLDKKD